MALCQYPGLVWGILATECGGDFSYKRAQLKLATSPWCSAASPKNRKGRVSGVARGWVARRCNLVSNILPAIHTYPYPCTIRSFFEIGFGYYSYLEGVGPARCRAHEPWVLPEPDLLLPFWAHMAAVAPWRALSADIVDRCLIERTTFPAPSRHQARYPAAGYPIHHIIPYHLYIYIIGPGCRERPGVRTSWKLCCSVARN